MEVYRINITDIAKTDIRDIGKYITEELQEPATAIDITDAILDAIFTLEQMPDRIALVKDKRLAGQGVRPLYVKNYTVFFRIVKPLNVVEVVRVLYSHRDWAKIL
jgi:plasmid stabilization system protein ParE